MRRFARSVLVLVTRLFGRRIIDQRTGEAAGRVIVFVWRGRIRLIGGPLALRPEFSPQERLTYSTQDIGFSSHPVPDFPDEAAPSRDSHAPPG